MSNPGVNLVDISSEKPGLGTEDSARVESKRDEISSLKSVLKDARSGIDSGRTSVKTGTSGISEIVAFSGGIVGETVERSDGEVDDG